MQYDRQTKIISYIDDHEKLGPFHLRPIVDLHRRVCDGLYFRALRVFANRELLAVYGCLDFKLLPVEFGNLDFLVTDVRTFSPVALDADAASSAIFAIRLFDEVFKFTRIHVKYIIIAYN